MPSQLTATYWRLNTGMRTLGVHLLDASQQGLSPDYTIADAAKGLRAGQAAAWPKTPVMEIFFHPASRQNWLASSPDERLQLILEGKLEQEMHKLSYKAEVTPSQPKWSWLVEAELQAVQLTDVRV